MILCVADSSPDKRGPAGRADAMLEAVEKVVYLGIAVLLVVASGVLLAVAAKDLTDVFDDFGTKPVVEALDTLLLLFILVELLSAVKRRHGRIGMAAATQHVEVLFKLTRLELVFTIRRTVLDAIDAIEPKG